MAEFDPYLKWLGIRDPARPVNYYRLLGLDLYESDKDIISMAADRQMAHIRTYQSGPNGDISQQILNELARARRCLLVEEKKLAYDQELKVRLGQPDTSVVASTSKPPVVVSEVPVEVVPTQVVPTVVPSKHEPGSKQIFEADEVIGVRSDPNARKRTKKRERKQLAWTLISWVSGGLAAVGVGALLINSGLLNVASDDPGKKDLPAKHIAKDGSKVNPPGKLETDLNSLKKNPSKELDLVSDDSKGKVRPGRNETKVGERLSNKEKNKGPAGGIHPSESEFTDLTRIDGIGLATQFVFYSQEVKTLNELAKMSPQEIANLLKKSNYKDTDRNVDKYQNWIIAAKKLTGDRTPVKDFLTPDQIAKLREANRPKEVPLPPLEDVRVGKSLPVVSRKPVPYSSNRLGRGETVVFYNALNETVSVYYVQHDGRATKRFELAPGKNRAVAGPRSSWYITNSRNKGIASFISERGENTAVIDGREPDGVVPSEANVADQPVNNIGKSNFWDSGDTSSIEKQPLPTVSDRDEAEKNLNKAYDNPLKSARFKKALDNRRTAERLISDARGEFKGDPNTQFVALDMAVELSLVHGDSITAIEALREIDLRFDKFDFWEKAVEAMEDSGRKIRQSGDVRLSVDLEKNLRSLVDEAIANGEARSANLLTEFGSKSAARRGDNRTANYYRLKNKHVEEFAKLKKQYSTAEAKIVSKPDDPKSNLVRGKFLLVAKNDIDGAMQCWAKSDDRKLRDISEFIRSSDRTDKRYHQDLANLWLSLDLNPQTLFGSKCCQMAIDLLEEGISRRTVSSSDRRRVMEELARLKKAIGS